MNDDRSAMVNAGIDDATRASAFLVALEGFDHFRHQEAVQLTAAYVETMPKADAGERDAIRQESDLYRRERNDLLNQLDRLKKKQAAGLGV